jgi:hypothetical protein
VDPSQDGYDALGVMGPQGTGCLSAPAADGSEFFVDMIGGAWRRSTITEPWVLLQHYENAHAAFIAINGAATTDGVPRAWRPVIAGCAMWGFATAEELVKRPDVAAYVRVHVHEVHGIVQEVTCRVSCDDEELAAADAQAARARYTRARKLKLARAREETRLDIMATRASTTWVTRPAQDRSSFVVVHAMPAKIDDDTVECDRVMQRYCPDEAPPGWAIPTPRRTTTRWR